MLNNMYEKAQKIADRLTRQRKILLAIRRAKITCDKVIKG